MTRAIAMGVTLALCLATGVASAQEDAGSLEAPAEPRGEPPPRARIRHAIEQGDLTTANTLLDAAMRAETMTRDELAELIALRALLAYADDRLGVLEESLAGIATLTPPGWLLDGFPPPVRARLAEVRAASSPVRLELELASEVVDGERRARVVTSVADDPGRLVRDVEVRLAVGDGPLASVEPGATLSLGDPHRDVVVRYALEGRGLGGASIATRGDDGAPERLSLAGLPVDDTFLHVALVTIGAVLVAGAVAFGLAYAFTDEFTQGRPTDVNLDCCGM